MEIIGKENIEFKMRNLNISIIQIHRHLLQNILEQDNHIFSLLNKSGSRDDSEVALSWQLEINLEMIFVKLYVFLEYLKELKLETKYKINKKLLSAGLRAYVTHKGTENDFKELCLPKSMLVIVDNLKLEEGNIFVTFLSGDHTDIISQVKNHNINLTKEIFEPHVNFIKSEYPDWMV